MLEPITKACTQCGAVKPATNEFWTPNQGGKAGWRSQCKICTNAKARTRSKKSEKTWAIGRRNGQLKRKYGIDLDGYNKLLAEQNGVCKICHATSSCRKNQKQFSVDHCHATGRVRGLLCVKCNTLIGILEKVGSPSKHCWNALLYLKNSGLPMSTMEPIDHKNPTGIKSAKERFAGLRL